MKYTIPTMCTILLLTLTVGIATPVLAETEIRAATPIETSLDALITIRDNDKLPAAEKEEQELIARRQVLQEALTLSIDEANSLLDSLKQLTEFAKESPENGMRNAFMNILQSYIAYYEQQLGKVDDLATIADVKALAQEIKTYRETVYNPNVQHIVDFILLFHNESIIEIAKVRSGKIVSDIRKLERKSFIEYGLFDESLQTANSLIEEAESLHKQAKDIMFTDPETIKEKNTSDIIEQTPTTIKTENNAKNDGTNDTIDIQQEPKVRDIILKSFDNIKSTYSVFLTISKNVRSILGIE